ncbi:MAG: hypothetical protein ACRDHB_04475 [Actinomycetota bacterium]
MRRAVPFAEAGPLLYTPPDQEFIVLATGDASGGGPGLPRS